MTTFFSEHPEDDLWRELLHFTFEANIKRYLDKKGYQADDDTVNCIAGSFLQANEYYKAAKNANLQISPLLLYYGSTNLLYGMANLLSGNINKIKNHGMKIIPPEKTGYISDTLIRFLSPENGGIHVFARSLGFSQKLTEFGDWNLREFLDSIPEINDDFVRCYNEQFGCIAMLDVFNTPDGKVEKVYYSTDNKEELKKLLDNVEGFEKSYLKINTAQEIHSNNEYFVLRHKLTGEDIGKQSFSGQPFLQAGHMKNNNLVTVPVLLNMYICLFALATLCRYYPNVWSPFVLKDTTGEKLLFEKLMYYSRRMIPNYVLNIILGNPVRYSSNPYDVIDTIKLVGEHQVQEMVKRTVKEELRKQKTPFKTWNQ